MDNQNTDYYIQIGILDKFIHFTEPQKDEIALRVVLKRIKESKDLYKYFFSQNPSSGWAKPLYEAGFFNNPPNVEVVENGYRTPPWQPSKYLVTIGGSHPEVTTAVVQEINTNNPLIQADLVEALTTISSDLAVKHIQKIISWMDGKYNFSSWGLPESIVRLILHLFQGGENESAFILLNHLLRPASQNITRKADYIDSFDLKPRFDLSYIRPDFWREFIPTIEKFDHTSIIKLLINKLKEAIDPELSLSTESPSSNWNTHGWRASIADTSQDKYNSSYKNSLLVALRDSILRYPKDESVYLHSLLVELLNDNYVIINRIGIFAVTKLLPKNLDIAEAIMSDSKYFYNIAYHNDIFNLLGFGFSFFPENSKQKIVAIINRGPLEEEIIRLREKFPNEIDELKQSYIDQWVRDRLWMVREYLSQENKTRLDSLVTKYGIPEHPEFLTFMSDVQSISDGSPISEAEATKLPPSSLIKFIKEWTPGYERQYAPIEISHRGFAGITAKVMLDNSNHFLNFVTDICTLPSPYVSAIFSRAQEISKTEKTLPWEFLFKLIKEYKRTNIKIETTDENRRTLDARLQAMNFLRIVLDKENYVPSNYIDYSEDLILEYLSDYDPDDERDNPGEGWFGQDDPLTIAINAVRPIALDNLFELLELRFNIFRKRSGSEVSYEFETHEKFLSKNIKHALDLKVDCRSEKSWAVHSIFGKWLWLLYRIDRHWLDTNLEKIFPKSLEQERYFLSAWDSYVVHTRPGLKFIEYLKPIYFHAIENLSKGKVTKTNLQIENNLASHILLEYLWSPYELSKSSSESLLIIFFDKCNATIRGKAIWTLWRIIEEVPPEEINKHWENVLNIWKWRITEYTLNEQSNEFLDEMQWFARILNCSPKNLSINELSSYMEPLLHFVDYYGVWDSLEEYLASKVEKYPIEAINYYQEMHNQSKNPEFGYRNYDDNSDKILITALKHPASIKQSLSIMDRIGRSGNDRYRKIYEEYT